MDKTWIKHGSDADMEYDPSNVEFVEWLALKFYNHKIMDQYTKNELWIYWTTKDDEVVLTGEELSDPDDENLIEENEVAKIFRIETNTCKEYKDDWIYEWNKDIPWPKDDGYCKGGNFHGAYIVGNILRYQDLEWYEALKDGKLKDEALKNKAIIEGIIDEDEESHNEALRRWDDYENTTHNQEMNDYTETDEERHELFNDTTHERLVYEIRRFEIIKYLFGEDEKYVAIKEHEYDDVTSTNEDACRTYQEIFHSMDEEWVVTRGD
ncbi:hypothetical protein Tco_1123344 [Tanacetum coccineum]|uniref:Uncharacterized protein n=1 Tax=Tanacetum coccineum TaxID=301880 RepID=A0ABQ5J6V4_9ASTR